MLAGESPRLWAMMSRHSGMPHDASLGTLLHVILGSIPLYCFVADSRDFMAENSRGSSQRARLSAAAFSGFNHPVSMFACACDLRFSAV